MPRHDRWETLRQLKFHKMQFCHYHIWIIIIIFFYTEEGEEEVSFRKPGLARLSSRHSCQAWSFPYVESHQLLAREGPVSLANSYSKTVSKGKIK